MTPAQILALRRLRSEQLKQSRIAANICQVDLSQLTGLSRQTIFTIERAKKSWTIDSEIMYTEGVKTLTSTKKSNR